MGERLDRGDGSLCGSYLGVYESEKDDAVLAALYQAASRNQASVTVAIPVPRIPALIYLAPVRVDELKLTVASDIDRLARRALAMAPNDITVQVERIPRDEERRLEPSSFNCCVARFDRSCAKFPIFSLRGRLRRRADVVYVVSRDAKSRPRAAVLSAGMP